MAYETILYEVSGASLAIPLNRADRLNTVTLGMGRELVETLVPLLVDESAGRRPADGDPPQSGSACAPGSAP